jgi:hypothetical protein
MRSREGDNIFNTFKTKDHEDFEEMRRIVKGNQVLPVVL